MAEGLDSQQQHAVEPENGSGRKLNKRKRAGILLVVLVVAGIVFGVRWWIHSRIFISTDNAFIEAHVHSIAPRVPGTITRVRVKENQLVRKGDLLVELDQADFRVRVQDAAAEVDVARNETAGDYAAAEEAKAAVSLAAARLSQAETDVQRSRNLLEKEVIPREQLERQETARDIAASQLRAARETLRKEQANLGLIGPGGKDARVAQKRAKLDEARLNLSYTGIHAPVDGYITRKSAEAGNYVQAGQPLMAIVPLDDAWITANYKESQLAHVRPGQQVEFTVDTYGGRTFSGRVESIMAGTGAAFSLLPPENATGNYVKVIQRIPVRIAIDDRTDPKHLLRIGMSVVPTIDTGRTAMDVLAELNPFR